MKSMLEFTVPSIPVAQPRQRTAVRGGFAMNYTPTKHPVNAFKASCQQALAAVYSGAPIEGPLWVAIAFIMPRPKSMIWKTKPMPREFHTGKPDRDNLQKSVMDALNGLLWADDRQICDGTISKFIASGDEQPHVEISVCSL